MPAPATGLALTWFRRPVAWVAAGLLALCAFVYWPTFAHLWKAWTTTPEYSHGFLVPAFAGYLLYRRRELLQGAEAGYSWWGVGLVLVACAVRMAGAYLGIDYLDSISLLPCLAGIAALLGGWPALRWAWPAILFLAFMVPLPFSVAHGLSGPLRSVATLTSGAALQTIGLPVVIEGNTILMDDQRIAVAEACSGLSMLFVFAALSTAVAIVIRRPWLDRAAVLLAAVPIAVAANVARITVTALAYRWAGPKWGEFIFHDLAGWLMMPLALGMIFLVLALIDVVLVPVPEGRDGLSADELGIAGPSR